ncbi:hypothetical protein JG688_00014105, partial [Phytophthora aleatoria]
GAGVIKYSDKVDAAFSCLGTTRKDAGSAEAFRKMDLGNVTKFAEVSKAVDVHYILFYVTGRQKGQLVAVPADQGRSGGQDTAHEVPAPLHLSACCSAET